MVLIDNWVPGRWLAALGLLACSACGGSSQATPGSGGDSAQAGEPHGVSGGAGGSGGGHSASGGTGTAGGGKGGKGGSGQAGSGDCRGVDCSALPNVRPGAEVECVDGQCVVSPEACELGFAHCSDEPTDGCETDVRSSSLCGACDRACTAAFPICTADGGQYVCATACLAATPTFCTDRCVDLQKDLQHCGVCETPCPDLPYVNDRCEGGQCVTYGGCWVGAADCSAEPGCESLDTPENCGACGRDDCGALHASPDCSNPQACLPPICDFGYANCDRDELDCETAYGTGCWPEYTGTTFLSDQLTIAAITYGSDGSLFIVGTFESSVDFDPSATMDVQPADVLSVFVTKLEPDSSYAWTRVIAGNGSVVDGEPIITVAGVAAGSAGSVVLAGSFGAVVDFDPGSASASRGSAGARQAYVLKLTADGNFDWVRTWADESVANSVTAGAGSIYVSGTIAGQELDLNPGSGVDLVSLEDASAGYLLKLTDAGDYLWGNVTIPCDSLAMASDGSVWGLDSTFIGLVAFESDGTARQTPSILGLSSVNMATTPGKVHVSGEFQGKLELGEGAAAIVRVQPQYATALVTLDLQGRVGAIHSVHEVVEGLAAAPDGVIAVTADGTLFQAYADGTSKFRLSRGAGDLARLITSNPNGFAVVGLADDGTDVDPGPLVRSPETPSLFISTYTF